MLSWLACAVSGGVRRCPAVSGFRLLSVVMVVAVACHGSRTAGDVT